jgi:hypothetical protein
LPCGYSGPSAVAPADDFLSTNVKKPAEGLRPEGKQLTFAGHALQMCFAIPGVKR